MEELLHSIAHENGLQLVQWKRLAGGDINDVFLLTCHSRKVVGKCNHAQKFPNMFSAEKKGLELLGSAGAFPIPEVLGVGECNGTAYLLLDFIENGTKNTRFWSQFAENLTQLHRETQSHFGLDHDNYIGSLRQYNSPERTAANFYLNQRLLPQFRMATDKGYSFPNLDQFYKNVSEVIPNEPPALVHGDLWNGNFMVSEEGNPVLIDPAVAFAPREMDLGMMHLFGGFDVSVFEEYNDAFPLETDWRERIPLWQLYYLLVHLNLFGSGYLERVREIVRRYA